MPIIKMPDGQDVSFPDDMPEGRIRSLIAQKFPKEREKINSIPRDINIPKGALDSFGALMTNSFIGDELQGLGAGAAVAAQKMLGKDTGGLSIGDAYNMSMQDSQVQKQSAREQLPWYGEMAAEAAPYVLGGAGAKGINAIRNFATLNTGKAALAGAGIVGASEGYGGIERGTNAAINAAAGGLAIPVGRVASTFVPRGLKEKAARLFNKPKPINSDDIQKQANIAYKQADEIGGTIKPEKVDEFISNTRNAITPETEWGNLVRGKEDSIEALVQRLETGRGKPLSLKAAQELDEYFGDLISKNTELGKLNADGYKIMKAQDALRETIETAKPSQVQGAKAGFDKLKEGRKLWSRMMKLRDIERIIERAQLMEQPATGIKSGFRTLLNNPKRMRGFTKLEKKLIKQAAETGALDEGLRTMGSRLIGIGGVVSGAGMAPAVAAQAGSMAARSAGSKLKTNQAQRLAQIIANPDMPIDIDTGALVSSMTGALTAEQLKDIYKGQD